MPATTTLLGLVTPTQGTLTGTWGDTVNYGITDYVDIAIAGTLAFAGDGAITLANTTGSSAGNSIGATTAQYAIIRVTGTLTTAKIITGPSYSKTYLVVNAATGSTVTFKASGQTGVSIAVGETALVYYNGTDYVKVVGTATAGAAGGSTTQVQYNNAGVLAGITGATTNGTALTLVAPVLGAATATSLQGIIGNVTPAAGSFTTLTASSTATLNTLVSSGATLTGGTINGMTVGATTASSGAFTTVTATQANTSTTLGTAPFVNLINTATATLNQVTGLKFRQQDGVYNGEGVIATVRTSATARTQAFVFCPSNSSGDPTEVLRLGDSTGAQVTGTLSATGTLSGGTSGTAYSFSGSAPATSLTLTSAGKLGIGVATPSFAVEIQGSVGTNGDAVRNLALVDTQTSGTNVGAGIAFGGYYDGTTSYVNDFAGIQGFKENGTAGNYAGGLRFTTRINGGSPTERMRLDSSGNLGIGTTSPAARVMAIGTGTTGQGAADTYTLMYEATSLGSGAGLWFGGMGTQNTGVIGSTTGSGNIAFQTYNGGWAERMRLTYDGNLGIGTTSPNTNLVVEGTANNIDTNVFINQAIRNSAAYSTSPRSGLAFAVKYNTAGSFVYGASVQGYKANATDGDFSVGLLFTTQLNGNAPAVAMTLNERGVVVLKGGNTASDGAGITFPATQSASSNANTLDDYEEGIWTPALSGLVLGNGTATGFYTIIGNSVSVQFRIVLGSTSVVTSLITLSGFPVSFSEFFSAYIDVLDSGTVQYSAVASAYANSATADLRGLQSSGTYVNSYIMGTTTPMTWAASDSITGSFTYKAG